MPRQLRIEYSGAIYHVMNRGDRRERIFRDDFDRERFLSTLAEACGKTEWQIHAYCLMNNHLHLVIETPLPNLVAGMKWLLGVYTKRFNIRHKECGHLFARRYKALMVDGSGDGYLKTVCDYVHLNPARAKVIKPDEKLSTFQWSSYGEDLRIPKARSPFVQVQRLLGAHGIPKDSPAGREEFERRMEIRRVQPDGKTFKPVERGWCLGREEFRQELPAAATERIGANNYGTERRETEEAKAQKLVKEDMGRIGWEETDLRTAAKGDKRKVAMAARVRRETTMSLKWIAERLVMGGWTNVSNLLGAERSRAAVNCKK